MVLGACAAATFVGSYEPDTSEITATVALDNRSTEFDFAIKGDSLYVTSLKQAQTYVEMLKEPSYYHLPKSARVDNSIVPLNWKYDSFKESEKGNKKTLVFTFFEEELSLKLQVFCVCYPSFEGAFEFSNKITNESEKDISILPGDFSSFTLSVPDKKNTRLVKITQEPFFEKKEADGEGDNEATSNEAPVTESNDKSIEITKLSGAFTTLKTVRTKGVLQDDEQGSFYMAQYLDRNSTDGVIVGLEWTNGVLKSVYNGSEKITFSASLDYNNQPFETPLLKGEAFTTPKVYLMAYEGSVDNGSDVFKKWFLDTKQKKNDVLNCGDSDNYLSLRTEFYDNSFLIHPSKLQMKCNIDTFNTDLPEYYSPATKVKKPTEDFDLHKAMLDMGFRSTCLTKAVWESKSGAVLDEYTEKYSKVYKEISPLIKHGELYHILDRPDGKNWDGVLYTDPDNDIYLKGVVFLFKPSEKADNVKTVVLDGLRPKREYVLTFEDRFDQSVVLTGEKLMTVGFDIEIENVGSEIVWITEAER